MISATVNDTESPRLTDDGPVKETEPCGGPGGAVLTVTTTLDVAVPPAPVAINVNVVVVIGLTELLPSAG